MGNQHPPSHGQIIRPSYIQIIRRPQLIKGLGKMSDEDELHMFYILLYKMPYTVQVGNARGEPFEINIEAPQGDCANAPEFTFTLAIALMLQNPD